MKRNVLLLLSFFVASLGLNAQTQTDGPVLKFETTHHDFGKIKEEDGPVTYIFKFKNTGNKPLVLTNVQPACGCTASKWTKDEVAPGKEGEVSATYDVNHRPGNFNKSITVYSNSNPNIQLLTFSGEVLPRQKTMEDSFPYPAGNVRFEMNHLNFGYLFNNQKDTTQMISLINTGKAPITIKEVKSQNTYIFSKELPMTVKPGQRAKVPVHYNASEVKDYGLIFDQFKLVTNDDAMPEKSVSLIADVHQYIPKMTDAEKEKAAKIYFPVTQHNFGTIKQGEMVSTEFQFTNKGKSELMIYKLKTSCGCTASEPAKMRLKPGETSTIKVTFNSAGKHGAEQKDITVYTNDPVSPESVLRISANVVTPENNDSGSKAK